MPICEHGHQHNVFDTGKIHTCKGCAVCDFIIRQRRPTETSEDLLDTLINNVLEYAVQENPEEKAHIPARSENECRELMSESIKKWVHQIFKQ